MPWTYINGGLILVENSKTGVGGKVDICDGDESVRICPYGGWIIGRGGEIWVDGVEGKALKVS